MKSHREALKVLSEARERFEDGPLAPERYSLAAEIYEAKGDVAEATKALQEAMRRAERVGDRGSAARLQKQLDRLRVKK